ncbi:hypothetical protein HA402_003255 [Bradysia odoriphaga]|nr:hypothetical protein HA402_003255 [Bradysia odoriphaga]
MATNRPPQTEEEVTSLQTKVYISLKDLFEHLAPVAVSFFGRDDIHYSYRLEPAFMPSSLPNPVFDFNATAVHGSSGTAETGFGGEIKFTIIWNDGTPAYNVYTCVGGRQMFHIISGEKKLTDEQFEANKKILMDLGISPDNFQYLKYDD